MAPSARAIARSSDWRVSTSPLKHCVAVLQNCSGYSASSAVSKCLVPELHGSCTCFPSQCRPSNGAKRSGQLVLAPATNHACAVQNVFDLDIVQQHVREAWQVPHVAVRGVLNAPLDALNLAPLDDLHGVATDHVRGLDLHDVLLCKLWESFWVHRRLELRWHVRGPSQSRVLSTPSRTGPRTTPVSTCSTRSRFPAPACSCSNPSQEQVCGCHGMPRIILLSRSKSRRLTALHSCTFITRIRIWWCFGRSTTCWHARLLCIRPWPQDQLAAMSDCSSPRASSLRSPFASLRPTLAGASSKMCSATAVLVVEADVSGTLMYL